MCTGMDAVTAKMIPAGATLKDAYWALPTAYTSGDRFDTHGDALAAGIANKIASVQRHNARTDGGAGVPLPERITVDLRWSMAWEPTAQNPSSGSDFVAARFEYEGIAAAEKALAMLSKFDDVFATSGSQR